MAGFRNWLVARTAPVKAMLVKVGTSGLKRTRWYEFLLRFGLGGFVTAGAGLLCDKFGPSFGGLFLGFPAILAASTTLLDKHERERKQEHGMHGTTRGRLAAAADATGATIGSIGLIAFAWVVCKLLVPHNLGLVVCGATIVFAFVSVVLWWIWKRNLPHRFRKAVFDSSS